MTRAVKDSEKERGQFGQVILYQTVDGSSGIDVFLKDETVWLTQAQMVALFERDQSVISRHVNKVFREEELPLQGNMQKMHIASSDKPVVSYSLDVVISVGYRVHSKRGTQFRIWATRILKEHLERGHGLAGIIGAVRQSFGGQDLYPSLEEKAAHLFYFVVKDHPFSDGNKRIGAFLFILYLRVNGLAAGKSLEGRTLVALTLLTAASDPGQKDVLIRLIINLIVEPV